MLSKKSKIRVESFLETDSRFENIKEIKDYKKVDVESFKYYDLIDSNVDWKIISTPCFYGVENTDTWFQTRFSVPDVKNVFYRVKLDTDALVIINDKKRYYSLNPFHTEVPLEEFRGTDITLTMCIFNGYKFPGYHPKENGRVLVTVANYVKDYPLVLKDSFIVKKRDEFYDLYYDVYTLNSVLNTLDENKLEYQKILSVLHSSLLDILIEIKHGVYNTEKAKIAREKLLPLLQSKNASIAPVIYSTGSSHLDNAWLWCEKETIRKAARTLSEMTYFMKEDPSFVFMHSQPIQILNVKKHYPKIFNELYKCYENFQFEPNGVGLVEPDCMLSSGEGHIRNLLIGRRVTKSLFNSYYGDVFYIPDSFGYTQSLVQILVKSNVKYIVTSKLGWNDTNRHPYDIFSWKGIDNSEIKACMIQGAYEGKLDPKENVDMYNKIQNKDIQDSLFRSIGEGDGGGGTRIEDLELMKRQEDLQNVPKNQWSTISSAMENIFKDKQLPVFDDELYLELHRATYTSQAKIKYYHRKLDKKLHNIEYLVSYYFIKEYITKNQLNSYLDLIDQAWFIMLRNQFHDILPGSSVNIVNQIAVKEYEKALELLSSIEKELIKEGNFYLNLTPFKQDNIKAYETVDLDNNDYIVCNNKGLYSLPWGEVSVNENGLITSLVIDNKQYCENFNQFYYGHDYPNNWDAWDLEYDNMKNLEKVDAVLKDGVNKIVFEKSVLEQEIRIYKNKARIDFVTKVDWNEDHKILKVNFNHKIKSSYSYCDIPFGYIKRTNKDNNEIEKAKFEICCCNYICQKDEKNSISLLNDCKYGHNHSPFNLGLSLLTSSKAPDENADMGIHNFTYSIFVSDSKLSSVISEAEKLNNDFVKCDKSFTSLASSNKENVVLETVKIGEDRESIIFRFRETLGIETNTDIVFSDELKAKKIEVVNLMEEHLEQKVNFNFTPFEIKTFKLKL